MTDGAATEASIIGDFDPLRDPPPGPVGFREGRTAAGEARKLRARYIHQRRLPHTPEELRGALRRGRELPNAFEVTWMVALAAGCGMEAAQAAVQEAMPELWADYWLALGGGA